MSAFPPKADVCSANRHVCFGPIADIGKFQSITSSARARTDWGTVMPSAFAVFLVDYKLIFGRRLRGANRPMTSEAVAIYFLFFGRGEAWFNSSSASCRKHSLNAAAKAV